MRVNESFVDRVIRVAVGVVVLALVVVFSPAFVVAVPLLLVGVVLLVTGVVGFCPLYCVFRFSTCRVDPASSSSSSPHSE